MSIIDRLFGIKKKTPLHVDDDNFHDEVLQSDIPVVLDVWGPKCVHCDRLAPLMEQLAGKYDGQVKVCELNSAEAPKTTARLGVRGLPTVLLYKPKGKLVDKVAGFRGWLFWQESVEHELLE